jgi:hypothetical protein
MLLLGDAVLLLLLCPGSSPVLLLLLLLLRLWRPKLGAGRGTVEGASRWPCKWDAVTSSSH